MTASTAETVLAPGRVAAVLAKDSAALQAGQTIFEYRIDKVLGAGGFGITYLAQDVNLQLPVAVKEYFPADLAVRNADRSVQLRSNDHTVQFNWGLERFIDEARALASFRHPNIVRVLRYFKDNGTAYIVMEYESGQPLKRWINEQPTLDLEAMLRIVFPILDGLEAVHKVKFLHRDIKPDNIYIRADGTPVLLDFGAARRVTGQNDLTNIVSPGFAPFEQYHSQGNQGPWTDLYSLGAVMYWMATGQKPVEAAARVRSDTMPKALDIANARLFGEGLLKAIDWALMPDESQRPQSVSAMRQALMKADVDNTHTVRSGRMWESSDPTQVPDLADSSAIAYSAVVQSIPLSNVNALRKNVLGTIMFLDMVAYGGNSVDQQVASKVLFNELVGKAIAGVRESSRIMIDTGAGAAICFLGDPEEALSSALLLRDLMQLPKYRAKLSLRAGLHMGPLRMVLDINERMNVVGDGINVAHKVMDFAEANEIIASREFVDVITRISDRAHGLFDYLGRRADKHLRDYDLYAVLDPAHVDASRLTQTVQSGLAPTALYNRDGQTQPLEPISPQQIADIETDLAKAIGPLAKVLIKKSIPRAVSALELREMLAVSIADPHARERFVRAKSGSGSSGSAQSQSVPYSGSNPSFGASSGSGSAGRSASGLSRPASNLNPRDLSRPQMSQPAPSQPYPSQPLRSQPIPSQPGQSRPMSSSSTSQVGAVSADVQAQLEKTLSQYIGPLAKTLVRRESARQINFGSLLQALAQHVDKPDDRAKFLAAGGKLKG
jgi:serine/threonine protein kinase